MSPFDTWLIEDAKIATQLTTERAQELDSYRKFAEGDHWQSWAGWIGPIPPAEDEDAAMIKSEIMRGFVSRNVLGEVVGRHVNGVLGRNVKWSLVPRRKLEKGEKPTPDEQARADEAGELLTVWVETRKLNQEFDQVCDNLLIAGVAYLRPFVAPGELDDTGRVPPADIATSLGRVYVHYPHPGEAVLYIHPRTQAKCSVYLYRQPVGDRPSQAQGKQGDERAELSYLDGDQTVIRILGGGDEDDFTYPLGRRLFMADLHRRPLLNPQVVSQQNLLNLALTMKERNVVLGGFLERVAINGQMNGSFETGADGIRRFVPNSLPVGAGAMTNLTGYVLRDDAGNETLATPSYLRFDPVPVSTFLDTERSAYHAILAECNQLHYAMSDDATASGSSRETAMAAYLIDLLQTKQQIDAAWSWLLETALSLAAVLAGQAGRFDDLRVSAEATVDPGPISVESMRAAMDLAGGQQLLSAKTARSWVGVEDGDAEQAQIEIEQEQAAEMQGPGLEGVQRLLDQVRGSGSTGSPTDGAAKNGATNAPRGFPPAQELNS